jgi:hypothetical protein
MRRRYRSETLTDIVVKYLHGCLYHLTDEAHLASIQEHGLLSDRSRRELGVVPAHPGGSELTRALDADRSLDDMVFLSFFNLGVMPNHDDARFRRPILLKVDAGVLYFHGAKVALGRANRSRTEVCSVPAAIYQMDWEVIFGELREDNIPTEKRNRLFNVYDYEVLVPKRVPVEYIIGTA